MVGGEPARIALTATAFTLFVERDPAGGLRKLDARRLNKTQTRRSASARGSCPQRYRRECKTSEMPELSPGATTSREKSNQRHNWLDTSHSMTNGTQNATHAGEAKKGREGDDAETELDWNGGGPLGVSKRQKHGRSNKNSPCRRQTRPGEPSRGCRASRARTPPRHSRPTSRSPRRTTGPPPSPTIRPRPLIPPACAAGRLRLWLRRRRRLRRGRSCSRRGCRSDVDRRARARPAATTARLRNLGGGRSWAVSACTGSGDGRVGKGVAGTGRTLSAGNVVHE